MKSYSKLYDEHIKVGEVTKFVKCLSILNLLQMKKVTH